MSKSSKSVGVFLLVAGLASAMAFHLQPNEKISAANDEADINPGMALAIGKGCDACHSIDGSAGIGPSWSGIYGSPRVMANGSRRIADDAYLRESMRDPAAEVVEGFQNIMIPPELSEAEITQLITLIRELADASPQ